jgi:hypothetical protein
MDPDEALRQIRLTAKQLQVDVTRDIKIQHADDLAVLILGLDEWLTKGGFLPTDWDNPNPAFIEHMKEQVHDQSTSQDEAEGDNSLGHEAQAEEKGS